MTADFNIKRAHEAIDEVAFEIRKTNELFESIVGGKVLKIKDYPWAGKQVSGYNTPLDAITAYNQEFEACKSVRAENLIAIENNKRIKEAVFKLMSDLGIPQSYTDYKTRSLKQRKYTWPSEISKHIPTSDNWDYIESIYKKAIENAKTAQLEIEEQIKKEQDLKKREIKNIKRIKILGILANKYELPITADQYDILEKMRSKNKYLDLAFGMLKTRMDWSDGPENARDALSRFTIETPTDQLIHDDIWPCIENWDMDGRIFRDIEWNYDVIFKIVEDNDPTLYKDYSELMDIFEW